MTRTHSRLPVFTRYAAVVLTALVPLSAAAGDLTVELKGEAVAKRPLFNG